MGMTWLYGLAFRDDLTGENVGAVQPAEASFDWGSVCVEQQKRFRSNSPRNSDYGRLAYGKIQYPVKGSPVSFFRLLDFFRRPQALDK
jgi:hypothetical protein